MGDCKKLFPGAVFFPIKGTISGREAGPGKALIYIVAHFPGKVSVVDNTAFPGEATMPIFIIVSLHGDIIFDARCDHGSETFPGAATFPGKGKIIRRKACRRRRHCIHKGIHRAEWLEGARINGAKWKEGPEIMPEAAVDEAVAAYVVAA